MTRNAHRIRVRGSALTSLVLLGTSVAWFVESLDGQAAGGPLGAGPLWLAAVLALVTLGLLVGIVARPHRELWSPIAIAPIVGTLLVLYVGGFGVPNLLALAGAALVVLVERQVRADLPEHLRCLPEPGAVLPAPPSDLDEAAAGPRYPYPAPLPPAAKDAHASAVARQRMWMSCWSLLFLAGLTTMFVGVAGRKGGRVEVSHFWASEAGLAAWLFFGGVAALALSAAMGGRHALRMYRHIRLLNAYGVATDPSGDLKRPGPWHRFDDSRTW
jgi:hypothetical protein